MIDNIMYWNMLIDLKRLLKICQAEITNLDYLIYKKKNIIEQIKVNKLINLQNAGDIITGKALTDNNILPFLNNTIPVATVSLGNEIDIGTGFKNIKSNQIKIKQTIKSITKNNKFNCKTYPIPINSNPITVLYNNSIINKNPIINQYLKSMSSY